MKIKIIVVFVKTLMKEKDPTLFGIILFAMLILSYIAGWYKVTPISALNSAMSVWQAEEVIVKSAEPDSLK